MLANNLALTLLTPSKFPHGSRFNIAREKGASRGVERRPDHRPRLALGGRKALRIEHRGEAM
jgi:hypothetical protein